MPRFPNPCLIALKVSTRYTVSVKSVLLSGWGGGRLEVGLRGLDRGVAVWVTEEASGRVSRVSLVKALVVVCRHNVDQGCR